MKSFISEDNIEQAICNRLSQPEYGWERIECDECDGYGEVKARCPECDGEGEIKQTCDECDGEGRVSVLK